MIAFNAIVRPILEYASQVWSPHQQGLKNEIEKIHRRAIRWAYRIPKHEDVSYIMETNKINSLCSRRDELDMHFLDRMQLGDYWINIKDYITFQGIHKTRGRTINPHFHSNTFKNSYFNRMRPYVRVHFVDDSSI